MIGKQGSYPKPRTQAAQAEGRGDIISTPTVITANQREATIESGTEIPFLKLLLAVRRQFLSKRLC